MRGGRVGALSALFDVESFDDVTFFESFETLGADTALKPVRHFPDVFLEPLQAGDPTLMNHFASSQHARQ